MFLVTSRQIDGVVIVDIRTSESQDHEDLFDRVRALLGGRRIRVILDIRGAQRPSSALLGSLMRIIYLLERPVPIIVENQAMRDVFQLLPPVGGLPWRIFEAEDEALEFARRQSTGRGQSSACN